MTLLNTAFAVYAGSAAAQAVYLGAEKVWPSWIQPGMPLLPVVKYDRPQIATSYAISLTQQSQQGNSVLFIGGQRRNGGSVAPNVVSITDDAGNVWTKLHATSFQFTNWYASDIWICTNAKPMSTATITYPAGADYSLYLRAALMEVEGTHRLGGTLITSSGTSTTNTVTSGSLASVGAGLVISTFVAADSSTVSTEPGGSWVKIWSASDASAMTSGAYYLIVRPPDAGASVLGARPVLSVGRSSKGITVGPA